MSVNILVGDCREVLRTIPEKSIQTCVTSPPYFGLRDYGVEGQIGLEQTPDEYVAEMVAVFREVRRVLRDDGTLWLNLGDSYWTAKGASYGVDPKQGARRGWARPQDRPPPAGLKGKDLIGVPWRVAFALQADGWYLRSSIIWHKPNPMPESVADRPTNAHENIFLLAKSDRYHFDAEAVKERAESERVRGPALHADTKSTNGNGGLSRRKPQEFRNIRNVWTVPTRGFSEAHFATFPPALIEPCIKAGCPAGTTGLVADRLGRDAILIELNPDYASMAEKRVYSDQPLFAQVVREAAEQSPCQALRTPVDN